MTIRCLLLLSVFTTVGFAQEQNADNADGRYTWKEYHDPNGIGKFYMGREIAHVMGFAGVNWLERSSREKEERLMLMVESLGLKEGDVVADIGCGSGVISKLMAQQGWRFRSCHGRRCSGRNAEPPERESRQRRH